MIGRITKHYNFLNGVAKYKLESRYLMFWAGLFVGLLIGSGIGATTIALVSINKDYNEKEVSKWTD